MYSWGPSSSSYEPRMKLEPESTGKKKHENFHYSIDIAAW